MYLSLEKNADFFFFFFKYYDIFDNKQNYSSLILKHSHDGLLTILEMFRVFLNHYLIDLYRYAGIAVLKFQVRIRLKLFN